MSEEKALEQVLDQFLDKNGKFEERIHAAHLFPNFGSVAVEPLLAVLRDADQYLIWWLAADALGRIGDKRAVEPLIALLRMSLGPDSIGLTRKYTCYALGELRDPRAVDVLIDALHVREHHEPEDNDGEHVCDEPDHEVIEAAAGALCRIGDPRAIEPIVNRLLEGDHWHNHCLGDWGAPALNLLQARLKDVNETTRHTACILLGESRLEGAIPPLVEVVKNDPSAEVRRGAVYGLKELRDPGALNGLVLALGDPDKEIKSSAIDGVLFFLDFPTKEWELRDFERKESEKHELVEKVLSAIGEENVVDILLGALKNSGQIGKMNMAVLLGRFGRSTGVDLRKTRVIPNLNLLLADSDLAVQKSARRALKFIMTGKIESRGQ